MDTYTLPVTQSDILAARHTVEYNLRQGRTSPAFLIRLADLPLPNEHGEEQEPLW